MEGRGRMESGGKNEALLLRKGKKEVDRREGREEEGICRTNVKVLPTPLSIHFMYFIVLHFIVGLVSSAASRPCLTLSLLSLTPVEPVYIK